MKEHLFCLSKNTEAKTNLNLLPLCFGSTFFKSLAFFYHIAYWLYSPGSEDGHVASLRLNVIYG